METMKTSIEKLIKSGVITSGTMLNYLLWQNNLDYDFIETVYRLKPKWMSYGSTYGMAPHIALQFPLGGRYVDIDSVTPLYVALLREDKTLEYLLLHLGAEVHRVVSVHGVVDGVSFSFYGEEEDSDPIDLETARSLFSEMRASARAVK